VRRVDVAAHGPGQRVALAAMTTCQAARGASPGRGERGLAKAGRAQRAGAPVCGRTHALQR